MKDIKPKKVDRDALYTAPAVQSLLGISRGTITRLIKEGRLPRNLIGGKFLWTGADILGACASLPTQKTMGAADPSKELK